MNTHKSGSLYETFAPEEARRISERLEIHDTPKHGSWLNTAEIEIGVLSRQCLNRRIPDQEELKKGGKGLGERAESKCRLCQLAIYN